MPLSFLFKMFVQKGVLGIYYRKEEELCDSDMFVLESCVARNTAS